MRKSRLIIFLLFLIMCQFIASNALAFDNSEQESVFKDVKSSHWGFKDVTKMSARNIVRGYIDGTFKPDKSVSQIEALLMIVRNMDSGSLLSDIDVSQPLPVIVPNWAEEGCKPEILFSIENGLIVPSENNFNASAPATRAWITKLLVRMINKENEAAELNLNPQAKDAADIPTWARSYTSWALKNRLIKGYPDGSFKPNQAVTRAEMASLLSRSEPFLDLGERVVHGKLLGFSGQDIFMAVKDELKICKISEDANIFGENGLKANISDLPINSGVTLVFNDSDAAFLEVLPSSYVLEKIRGTVSKVLTEEGVLIFKDNKQNILTGVVSDKAFVTSQKGDINSLAQVTPGSQVEIGYNSVNQAVSVIVLNGNYNDSEFIIHELKTEENLMIVKTTSGQARSFNLSKNVTVKIPGVRFPVIDDLQPGDKVSLSFSGSTVHEIELLKANQEMSLAGKVVFISTEKNLMAVQTDSGSIETYPIEAGVKVTINGYTRGQLSDVGTNDSVVLDVQNGSVISITVNNKSQATVIAGIIVSIDHYNDIITISNEKTYELQSYKLSKNASIIIDGRKKSISGLDIGMRVELQLEDNKITSLEHKNTVEGIVKSIDERKNRITITTENASKTYELDDDLDVYIPGRSRSDLDDVNIADYAELKTDGNKVTEINIRRILNYQIVKVSESSKEITVWDTDGSSKKIVLDSKTIIDITDISNPGIRDLAVGSNITVTFTGKRTSKITVNKVLRGKVTAVNLTTETLTVENFKGKTETVRFTDRCQVIKGSAKSYKISSLSQGDRIEAVQTGSSAYDFIVMTRDLGNYQSLTLDNTKIKILKSNSFPLTRYLASDVYIHKGSQSQTLPDLSTGTQIDLYSLNDIVFEIDMK